MSATNLNTNVYNTAITLTSSYQSLATLLVTAGFTSIANNPVVAEGMFRNIDGSIDCFVAAGYTSAPTASIGKVTPLAAAFTASGLNANEVWLKGASGTPVMEVWIGAVNYSNPVISGLIGTITLTDDTIPKGDSGNLVNSRITDDGTDIAIDSEGGITSIGDVTSGGNATVLTLNDATNSIIATNASLSIGSSSGSLGYSTGAGFAVTQGTNRTTAVHIDAPSGAITLISAAGSATPRSFTVTCASCAATDTPIVVQKSGTDLYEIFVTAVAAGSFRITSFTTGGTTTETPVFNYNIIKGSAS